MHDYSFWKGGCEKKLYGLSIPNHSQEKKKNRDERFYSPGFAESLPIPVDSNPYLEFNITIFVCTVWLLNFTSVGSEQLLNSY